MGQRRSGMLFFASPALSLAALGLPIAVILPPLYAELGLSLTAVGTVFMLARFFDVFTDPLFGILGDRLQTRWGRRKPAIALGAPILLAGVYFLFLPGVQVSESGLLVALLVLYSGWTLMTIAHTAWASELSGDYDRRSEIMSTLQAAGLIGAVCVMSIPTIVDWIYDQSDMRLRAQYMGWFVLMTLPIFTLFALYSIREAVVVPSMRINWRESWASLRSNMALRRLLLADVLMGFQGGVNGSLHFFLIIHVFGLPEAAAPFLLVIFLTGLLCVPLFLWLSKTLGKHQTLCLGAIQSTVATSLFFFLPANELVWTFGVFVMVGVNFGAKDFLMRSMMADVIDQDHVMLGRERSALFYSMLTLTGKIGTALAVGLVFPILDLVGFDPNGSNHPDTLQGVRWVAATAPTTVTILVALIMWKFPLGRAQQVALRGRLEKDR